MINRIPYLIKKRGYSLSEFQRKMMENKETELSYQSLHRVANHEQAFLPSSTKIGTLVKIATVLRLTVNDLFTMEESRWQ